MRRSCKPGRVPSRMGFASSVFAIIFGLFWTMMAFSMSRGAPSMIALIFPLFGLIFILTGIWQAVYHYKNAHGSEEERASLFDIIDSPEGSAAHPTDGASSDAGYCPYCGTAVQSDFTFCPKCGRTLR